DILAALKLEDAAKSQRVHDAIMGQYRSLRAWHDANDAQLKALNKDLSKADKSSQTGIQTQINEVRASLKTVHENFVAKLAGDLTPEQVDMVKDKMTYNKVKVTYDAYCEIVPNLTQEEKARMLDLLKEARE